MVEKYIDDVKITLKGGWMVGLSLSLVNLLADESYLNKVFGHERGWANWKLF